MRLHIALAATLLVAAAAVPVSTGNTTLAGPLVSTTTAAQRWRRDGQLPALPPSLNHGTYHEIDKVMLLRGIMCVHENICPHEDAVYYATRCVIDDEVVVYVCSYERKNYCDKNELLDFWDHLQKATGSKTGWVYRDDWSKTIGFDTWFPNIGIRGDYGFGEHVEMCENVPGQGWSWDIRALGDEIKDVGLFGHGDLIMPPL